MCTQSPLGEYWVKSDEIKFRNNIFDDGEDGTPLWNDQI